MPVGQDATRKGCAAHVEILLACFPPRREAVQWFVAVLFHEGHVAGNAMLCVSLYYDGYISLLWGLNERGIDSQRGHDSSARNRV
jgi:hypothetical protein